VVAPQDKPIARRTGWRPLVAAAAAAGAIVLLGTVAPAQGDIASQESRAATLKSQIAAESARIAATADGVASAQERLAGLQAKVDSRRAEIERVNRALIAARDRLTRLENRYHAATLALANNLRAEYKGDQPDLVSVLIQAHGFSDLLERMEFLQRMAERDARIVGDTRSARSDVVATATELGTLQARNRKLAAEEVEARNGAAAIQTALLDRQAEQLRGRADKQAELDQVRGQIAQLHAEQAKALRAAQQAAQTTGNSLPTDPGGFAQAPAGAPAAVAQVIAAGNAIAGLPYLYGGGHSGFQASAYDCSGSVSYALAAAGLVSSPLNSTAFESWGEAGPGQWITVYANAGHAYMVVAGWRFDTSALSGGGTRWSRDMRSNAGFVARHPAGL
jgi:peptidoglycan hydrolase CwlO-like protein